MDRTTWNLGHKAKGPSDGWGRRVSNRVPASLPVLSASPKQAAVRYADADGSTLQEVSHTVSLSFDEVVLFLALLRTWVRARWGSHSTRCMNATVRFFRNGVDFRCNTASDRFGSILRGLIACVSMQGALQKDSNAQPRVVL